MTSESLVTTPQNGGHHFREGPNPSGENRARVGGVVGVGATPACVTHHGAGLDTDEHAVSVRKRGRIEFSSGAFAYIR
eukprot:3123770-Pyramimonas_sp.AAC.1